MVRKTPVPGFSWELTVEAVRLVEVEPAHGTWTLVFMTTSDVKRRVALQGTLRAAFARLYPEFAEESVRSGRSRVVNVTIAVLVLLCIAAFAAAWYIRHRS